MEKSSRDTKENLQPRNDGSGPRKDHHKHGSRDRLTIKSSRRSYDNFTKKFTPLNLKRANILHEVYHLKLISERSRPKRSNAVMGKYEDAWYAYHRLRGHHSEDCHQLKREIKILIQRGQLLSYVKDIERSTGKRGPSQREPNSENLSIKKGKSIKEVCETRVASQPERDTLGQ